MADSSIEWTDKVWNPVRGCSRVSPGCDNCYAMGQAHRFAGPGKPYEGLTTIRKGKVDWQGSARLVPEMLDQPLRWKKPRRIFVNSMSDLFHESLSFEEIAAVFGVMAACPQHTFQVLTKRPKRALEFFANLDQMVGEILARVPGNRPREEWYLYQTLGSAEDLLGVSLNPKDEEELLGIPWPLPNVWLGVSVENQKTADERIPLLLQCPAAVRFVSAEPLLGPVDLGRRLRVCSMCGELLNRWQGRCDDENASGSSQFICGGEPTGLDWVIVGAESGHGARDFHLQWARDIVRQCGQAGVACFVKQLGAKPLDYAIDMPVPYTDRFPLKHKKGADMSEWPGGPWPREFPEAPHA